MSERRYSEREIREVFERAARDQEQAKASASQEGLTLDEMQEIAASAGIAPEFVANAARSVALGEPEQGRMSLGPIPRGVFRTELLPGPPTEALWAELVADLRRTFSAQGNVTETHRVREWRNGNLRVTLEPAGEGSRLHLQTRRDRVQPQLFAISMAAFICVYAVLMSTIDTDPGKLALGGIMLTASLAGVAGLWVSQRSWATTREQQMEAIAQRAGALSQDVSSIPEALPTRTPVIEPGLLDLDAAGTRTHSTPPRTRS